MINLLVIGYEKSLSTIIKKISFNKKINKIIFIGDEVLKQSDFNVPVIQVPYQSAKFFYKLDLNDFNLDSKPIDINELERLYECESIYLKMIERISFENSLDSYNNRLAFYNKNLNFWYNFLIQNNINLVFTAVIPHVGFDYLVYNICKIRDIKNFSFYKLPTINNEKLYKYLLTDYKEIPLENKQFYLDDSKNDLQFYKNTYNTFYENKTFTGTTIDPFFKKFNIIVKFYEFFKKDIFFKKIKFQFKYIYYKKKLNKILKYHNADYTKKYIYLPLHFQPEASTMPLANLFSDQLLIIEYLSFCLPKNTFLYIKEHKRKSLLWYDLERLEKILKNPYIKFVNTNCSSVDLTKNSSIVATASGSTGFEALFNNKFVLVFGNIFYEKSPNVYKVSTLENLKRNIDDILGGKVKFDQIGFNIFLKKIEEYVIEGYSDLRYEINSKTSQETNINNTIKLLEKQISVF